MKLQVIQHTGMGYIGRYTNGIVTIQKDEVVSKRLNKIWVFWLWLSIDHTLKNHSQWFDETIDANSNVQSAFGNTIGASLAKTLP